MIKKYIAILMTLVLISSLFIPGVMAQEDEKEYLKEIPQVVNGRALTNEDESSIENLVYYFLNAEGIEIQNLDLSQLKIVDSGEIFEFGGMISYDVVNGGSQFHSTEMYVSIDFTNSLIQIFSKSGSDYYEMHASMSDAGDFTIREVSVVNGLVQRNVATIPASSQTSVIELSTSGSMTRGQWVYVDLPSIWSHFPFLKLAFDDVKLSDILTATSLAILIAGEVGAAIGTLITIANWLFGQLTGVETNNIYVDIFKVPFGSVISTLLPGVLGKLVDNMYVEVDYYWVYK